ncbi:ATP-binding cassette domain-containing protein [bacterium]|nr:ATP-binding cassette domain-containing protein [bacterium]
MRVNAGSCVVLVGPNGSGKSTALRIAAGVLAPTSGRVVMAGCASGVMLDSERSFYLRLTARRNLDFFARVAGVPRRVSREIVDETAGEFGVAGWLDAPVADLSRGARTLLALARAVLAEPPLLILDEPLTGVDASGCARVREAIERQLARGAGVLMTGHSVKDGNTWGDILEYARRDSGEWSFLPRS